MSKTKDLNASDQHYSPDNQILPTSYILWLTMRSRFVDELTKQNAEILNTWSHFEDQEQTRLEKEWNDAVSHKQELDRKQYERFNNG